MNWVELHPPRPYTVVWQRMGERERFQHTLTACSEEEARRQSQRVVALGLGANYSLWGLHRVICCETETELVSSLR